MTLDEDLEETSRGGVTAWSLDCLWLEMLGTLEMLERLGLLEVLEVLEVLEMLEMLDEVHPSGADILQTPFTLDEGTILFPILLPLRNWLCAGRVDFKRLSDDVDSSGVVGEEGEEEEEKDRLSLLLCLETSNSSMLGLTCFSNRELCRMERR